MISRLPAPRAIRRPVLAWVLLATCGARAGAEDAAPPPNPGARSREEATPLRLGTPIVPPSPSAADAGIGLESLDANGATLAALRSDGRVLVVTAGAARVVEPPADGEAFRTPIVGGDGVPIVVTTRGRIAFLEAAGVRFLARPVPRSTKVAAIPGSPDVVLGAENGSIRRLVRAGPEPRIEDLVERGDEPVGALAASRDRVVYARLDGVVLGVPLTGGEPTVLARPTRDVRAVRFLGTRAFTLVGSEFRALDEPVVAPAPTCVDATPPPDADGIALTADGRLVALLADGILEVRRIADGAHVRSDVLRARRPTALAWRADGRTLFVATARDARPYAIPVESGGEVAPDEAPAPR